MKGACCSESQQDHRGRALINELSATVSTVKNMNSKKLIKHDPSPQTPHIFGKHSFIISYKFRSFFLLCIIRAGKLKCN